MNKTKSRTEVYMTAIIVFGCIIVSAIWASAVVLTSQSYGLFDYLLKTIK